MTTASARAAGAFRVWLRNFESWKDFAVASLVGTVAEPLLYFAAIGFGLGRFVDDIQGQPYVAFLAPGLVAATAIFGAIKPGYPLVPLLGLAIPPHRLGGGGRWMRWAAALVLVVALGVAITFAFLQGAKTATHGSVEEESAARLQAVMAAPAAFTVRAAAFWLDELGLRMEEFVGNLGWLDTRLPSVAVLLALWVLFALSQVDGMKGRLGLRGAAAALFLTTIALLTLHTHLASRPEHFIDGFQGRYLLPLAPLLLVAAGRRTERLDRPGLPIGVAVLSFLLLATACFVLFRRYWA